MKVLRRRHVKITAVMVLVGLVSFLPSIFGATPAYSFSQSPIIDKFANTLPGLGSTGANNHGQYIPLASKQTGMFRDVLTDKYYLGVSEFSQALDPQLPGPTTLWGYYDRLKPDHKYLGGVIVAKRGTPVLLEVVNKLPNREIIPIDPTIAAGNMLSVGDLPLNRLVTHLHGGFTPWISDGTPMQWSDRTGLRGESFRNVPGTAPPVGGATYYYPMNQSARLLWYHDHAMGITRTNAYSGIASALVLTDDFENYLVSSKLVPDLVGIPLIIQDKSFVPVDIKIQDPSWKWGLPGSLWYPHVYEATAGPWPACTFSPTGRWDYGACPPPFLPPIPPSQLPPGNYTLPDVSLVPEFFADTTLVNGAPYPQLNLTQGTFRFRILNGSQARFWHFNLYEEDPVKPGEILVQAGLPVAGPTMYQIGTEGGFLPDVAEHPNTTPIPLDLIGDPSGNSAIPTGPFNLLLAPAERADVLIDFTGFQGKSYILYSDAPAPFPMGDPRNDYFTDNQDQTPFGGAPPTAPMKGPNTRTVMRISVANSAKTNGFVLDQAKLNDLSTALKANFAGGNPVAPQQPPLLFPDQNFPFAGKPDRMLTLNEDFDEFGRLIQTIGTTTSQVLDNQGLPTWGIPYMMDPTETPAGGTTEVWQIANLTGDTHPIHFHLVNVQVIQRQDFVGFPSDPNGIQLVGPASKPDPDERGWKETVRMNPGQVTTVIMKFDLPKVPFTVAPSVRDGIIGNEYVWHCHILEHEEHDMMRPLVVTGPSPLGVFPETQKGALLPVDYTIYNGVPPYSITSDNAKFPPTPAKVKISGGKFVVPVAQSLFIKNPSTINFTITDSAGNKENVTLKLKY